MHIYELKWPSAAGQIIPASDGVHGPSQGLALTVPSHLKIQKPYVMLLTHHQTGEDNLYANRGAF